jgi:ligand-binding sensor domain-containing protein
LITSISIDTTGNNQNYEILLSTAGGEIFGYDTLKQITRKIENPGLGTIFAFKYGYNPTKWLGTNDGFFSKSKNAKWKKNNNYFTVYQIIENNGKYWAIGRGNNKKAILMLYYDEDGKQSKFKWKDFDLDLLNDKYVKLNELAITDSEIAWIATENGLIRYNPRNASLSLTEEVNGIDLKSIQHIAVQSENIIWISSSGRRLIKVEIK